MTSPDPQTPSLWRLFFRGYVALIAAVVLGVLAAAPVIISQVRYYAEMNYVFSKRPADDTHLKAWASAQPGVLAFTVERRGDDLWIRCEYHGSPSQRPPSAQLLAEMRRLGYEFRGMHGGSTGMVSGIRELMMNPLVLAVMLAAMQVAFGLIGWHRVRVARQRGEAWPAWFPGNHGRAVTVGALGGLGLIAFGEAYTHLLAAWLGHAPPSPWESTAAMPAQAKMVLLLFGGLGAPVAEEIFFRGYLFGQFKRAGYVGFGLLFSSVLFGVVHFSDFYNIPAICVFGVVLAWLYHRTGSLLTPITAHVVNNALLILWMIFS